MLSIAKRIATVPLRFAVLVVLLFGLTYVTDTVAAFSQYLIYVLYGALLIIGISFRKQKAVLLLCLFFLLLLPLDFPTIFPGVTEFDSGIISGGIVVLLAVNTLLLGLFQEGQIWS